MPRVKKVRVRLSKTKLNPNKWWDDMTDDDGDNSVYQNHYLHIVRNICPELGHDPEPNDILKCLSEKSRKISSFIDGKRTIGTKKAYYNSMAVFYTKNGQPHQSSIFKTKTQELADEYKDMKDDNKLDSDRIEHFVRYDNILSKRDEYRELFKDNPENRKVNLQYLILCLYTYQPPIRSDYDDMRVVKGIRPTHRLDNNYLWFNGKTKKYTIILNNDKVSETYAHRNHSDIIIESSKLKNIINASLAAYPRRYILSLLRNPEEPLGYQNFRRILQEIWKEEGKLVGVDILRSSYITDFYRKRPTTKARKQLAIKMRHSAETADSVYNIIDDLDEIDQILIPKNTARVRKERKQKPEPTFDLKVWTKQYREKPKVRQSMRESRKKYYEKNKVLLLRKKIIRNLDSGNVKNPTEESIKKYNLKSTQGKWV